MLPPFIIDQIRQREEREQQRRDDANRPRVQLPIGRPLPPNEEQRGSEEDESERGVVILDLMS